MRKLRPHTSTVHAPLLAIEVNAGVLHVTFGGDWKIGASSRQVAASIEQNMEALRVALSIAPATPATALTTTTLAVSGSVKKRWSLQKRATPPSQPPLVKKRFFHRKRTHPIPLLTSSPVLALELSGEKLGT
ncbi:MAG: hypothetical protein RR014_03415, partial [Bilophila sp.]